MGQPRRATHATPPPHPPATAPEDPLYLINEAAEYLRKPVPTMRHMRLNGTGPKSAKLGRSIVYRKSDLDRWIAEQFEAAEADRARSVSA
jgi:predicted DNA-binding transcriptional regulator AlpA